VRSHTRAVGMGRPGDEKSRPGQSTDSKCNGDD
jgi:hypothetical protein